MWKICRNLGFTRWYVGNYKYAENKGQNPVSSQSLVISPPFTKNEHSDEKQKNKEHFNKQSERFWNCSQFQFLLSKSLLFETAGWLGTVTVLCFKFHHEHFKSPLKHEKAIPCMFARNVHAMWQDSVTDRKLQSKTVPENHLQNFAHTEELNSSTEDSECDFIENLQKETPQYAAAIQNSAGLACLESNGKKAFRHFQSAARLGSSQGFYNLGLCYELGKGTRVNLSRAAFCYRKAAMKGHGLASFNLAVYFNKGLGGLPVDPEAAKLLLEEAAAKNVPEAQIYLGLEHIEEKRWSEAYKIFDVLAKNNVLDGKYYLGLCHENGWHVDKNMRIAVDMYSQTAALGHSKSILSLSRCYEEGLGGCDTDLDFAMALCQIVADQGDSEGSEALLRLKIKKEQTSIKDIFKLKLPLMSTVSSSMHTSLSVPEFTSSTKSAVKSHPAAIISSYLDLVSFPAKETKRVKPGFYVGEDFLNQSFSPSCIPCVQS